MALNLFDFDMRPTQLLDQHFGLGLHPEELFAPLSIPHLHHRHSLMRAPGYYRPWRISSGDTGSTVNVDKDKFQVNLDVQQFSPEELTVKVVDDCVIVEGQHEEKQDEHGFVSRQFQRRYVVPKGHDVQNVISKLSSDGVLTISVPKLEALENKERSIPITHTGKPHKAVKAAQSKESNDK